MDANRTLCKLTDSKTTEASAKVSNIKAFCKPHLSLNRIVSIKTSASDIGCEQILKIICCHKGQKHHYRVYNCVLHSWKLMFTRAMCAITWRAPMCTQWVNTEVRGGHRCTMCKYRNTVWVFGANPVQIQGLGGAQVRQLPVVLQQYNTAPSFLHRSTMLTIMMMMIGGISGEIE